MFSASIFQKCGLYIGRMPLLFFALTALMLLSASGLIGLKLRDNVRDGYCPKNSRARLENQIYRKFVGTDPVLITLLVQAKDNGSMHRMDYLQETVKQWNFISNDLSVPTHDDSTLSFQGFCGHYCRVNDAVKVFTEGLQAQMKNPNHHAYRMMYPVSSYLGYKFHLERNFFGVRTSKQNDFEQITNIEHVKLISMSILAEAETMEKSEQFGRWELNLFEFCKNYSSNPNNILEISVIGIEIVDTEMNKDAQKMTPYFIIGFSAMLSFVIATVYMSAYNYGYAGCQIFFIGLSCALVPTFAIITSLGLNNLLGFRTNSPMLIMPFLIDGIGVNDAFLLLHSWMRQDPHLDSSKRIANVLTEVGPSMTTTTITNVVVFLIGWYSPTEEMSIFCFGSALALFFAYLYTFTFFSPLLVYVLDKPVYQPIQKTTWLDKFLNKYCKLICDRRFFKALLVATLIFLELGMIGTLKIDAKLDTAKILPLDTPIRKPNRLIEEVVWKEFYPVTVFIEKPLDFSNSTMMETLNDLVHRFETDPGCRGSDYTISWVRDYQKFFWDMIDVHNLEWLDIFHPDKPTTSPIPRVTAVDYRFLEEFLKHDAFEHHRGAMKVDLKKEVPIRKFSMTFVFHNSTSWKDRVKIMLKWRSFVDEFPSLKASVWNVNAMFVDQMLSLKPLAVQNVIVTLVCMAIVCLLFIQNLISTIIATLAILSISLGVTGGLSFWNLDLDPVSLCAVLVAIGMAVDFVAHTTCHYQIDHYTNREGIRIPLDTPFLRVKYTLINIALPMIQAGISTVLCIVPLVHLQNYLPLVFVKTIIIVVFWGLFHGLVLIPSVLAQIPLEWFKYHPLSRLISQFRLDAST